SVRKDDECFFGMLKARFRMLRGSMPFQTVDKIDNTSSRYVASYTTCCTRATAWTR
ncbi:unnamed protein product, partial [Sphacelaria rigidula]